MPKKKKPRNRDQYPSENAEMSEWFSHVCLHCGRCCIQSPIPVLGDDEAEKLFTASNTPHSFEEFKAEHLCEINWEESAGVPEEEVFKGKDGRRPKYLMMGRDGKCPFLEGRRGLYKCSAYGARPEACSTFDCKPLMWFRRFFLTGLLTYTERPKSTGEACRTVTKSIKETNAMMPPPDASGNFDPRRLIIEKHFSSSLHRWNSEPPKNRRQRITEYVHELPRNDGEETNE